MEFATVARRLLSEEGLLSYELVETNGDRCDSEADQRTKQIRYGAGMRQAPVRIQRFYAAHEVGHARFNHRGPAWAWGVFAAWLLVLLALPVVELNLVVVIAPGLLIGTLAYWVFVAWHTRRQERAADAWAVSRVGPLTEDDRAWLRTHEGRPVDRPCRPGETTAEDGTWRLFRTHDKWAHRGHW